MHSNDVTLGSRVIIAGWGQIYEEGPFPRELRWTTLMKVKPESCGFSVGFTDKIMCLDHPDNESICYGDSGGPAIYENELIGIASFMIGGCGSMFPSGYVKINEYIDWINNTIFDISYNSKPYYL